MSTLSERIATVVEESKLSKTKFAEKINISQPYLSQICSGAKTPSDRTISDICRIFKVREEWLREGTGDMYLPAPEYDDEYINALLSGVEDPVFSIIKATLKVYLSLPPEDQQTLQDFVEEVARKAKEDRD